MRWTRRSRLMVVTGGSGFLGRHVLGAAGDADWELVAPPSRMLDITNRARVLDDIASWKPAVVVHLACRTDRRTIIAGSANVAEAAARCRARLVHLSTDVVFRGRPAAYNEADRPDATYDYGRWKAEAEAAVAAAAPSAVLLRTSLLYGTDVLGRCQLDIQHAAEGRATTAFYTDEVRCPAFAGDVATAVVTVASRRDLQGPLHVAGPDPISRYDFAVAVARWMGFEPGSIRPEASPATDRPRHVVLDSSRAAADGLRCRPLAEVLR